jgi:hypothetical protein
LERRNGPALIAPTHGDAALMILRRYCVRGCSGYSLIAAIVVTT